MVDERRTQEHEAQRRLEETQRAAREVRDRLAESMRLLDEALAEDKRPPRVPLRKARWRPWRR